MTKYRHLTNEELLRMWDSLEPLYLMEEARLRIEQMLELYPDLRERQNEGQLVTEGEEE